MSELSEIIEQAKTIINSDRLVTVKYQELIGIVRELDALQPPPAPTDLLLTEQVCHACHEFKECPTTDKCPMVKLFLSKQPRPTEQAREDAARIVFEAVMSNATRQEFIENGISGAFPVADQILRLLPDEQAIEKRVRKEIGQEIESQGSRWYAFYRHCSEKYPQAGTATLVLYLIGEIVDSLQSGQMPEAGEQPGGTK